MQSENSRDQSNELEMRLALLRRANAGELDKLECPQCHDWTVDVYFTHPAASEYRTWFVCTNCTFEMRAQNSSRPEFFNEGRVSKELEARDIEVLTNRRL